MPGNPGSVDSDKGLPGMPDTCPIGNPPDMPPIIWLIMSIIPDIMPTPGVCGVMAVTPACANENGEMPPTPPLAIRTRRSKLVAIMAAGSTPVSYTHLRAHETDSYLVCRLL